MFLGKTCRLHFSISQGSRFVFYIYFQLTRFDEFITPKWLVDDDETVQHLAQTKERSTLGKKLNNRHKLTVIWRALALVGNSFRKTIVDKLTKSSKIGFFY